MRSFAEVKASIIPEVPYKNRSEFVTYFGYSKGSVIGTFPTKQAATEAGATTTEKHLDEESYNAWRTNYRDFNDRVMAAWQKEVRDEYPPMTDAMFNHIWQTAYENGHSSGHEEVAVHFNNLYDFAMTAVEINK